MPRRRRMTLRRKLRKRAYTKRRKFSRRGGGITRVIRSTGLNLIAPRYITKLKYAENISVTIAAGQANNVFNFASYHLNNLFTPNLGGGGHQPYSFDQLALLYHRYRVFATSWRVTIDPYMNNSVQGRAWVVPLNTNTSLPGIPQSTVTEYPRVIRKDLNGTVCTQFKGHIYLPRLCGAKNVEYKSDDRFQALTTGAPVELMTLQALIATNTAASATYTGLVQLVFHCEFFDPIPYAASVI